LPGSNPEPLISALGQKRIGALEPPRKVTQSGAVIQFVPDQLLCCSDIASVGRGSDF